MKSLLDSLKVIFIILVLYIFYDVFIKENFAKKINTYKSNGLVMKKEIYITQKMCNYHLDKLYNRLEDFAMYSDSEKIIKMIFSNSDVDIFRTSNMSLEFDSYFGYQIRMGLNDSELSKVHIKIENGIVEISYPKIK